MIASDHIIKKLKMHVTSACTNQKLIERRRQRRVILGFYHAIILMGTLVFIAQNIYPSLLIRLGLSRMTPWGILTSIFVHGSFEHLLVNIVFLSELSFILALIGGVNDHPSSNHAVMFYCCIPFTSVMAANIVILGIYLAAPLKIVSLGASGLGCAMIGTFLMTSSCNMVLRAHSIGIKAYFTDKRQRSRHFLPNIVFSLILLWLTAQIQLNPTDVGTRTDTLGHCLGLLFGILLSFVYLRLSGNMDHIDASKSEILNTIRALLRRL